MRNMKKTSGLLAAIITLLFSSQAWAQLDAQAAEFTIYLPYYTSEKYDFDGGATAETRDDFGLGFSMAYNINESLAFRGDINWLSLDFDGTRVIEDGSVEDLRGDYDVFDTHFGLDYYLMPGRFSPFVNVNVGWAFVDTNVPDGPPGQICWYDPWLGYVCQGFQPTRDETSFHYGGGVGVRFDLNRDQYLRFGWYQDWFDFKNSDGDETMDSFRFEFGVSF